MSFLMSTMEFFLMMVMSAEVSLLLRILWITSAWLSLRVHGNLLPISARRPPLGFWTLPSSSLLPNFSRSFDPHDCSSSPSWAKLLRRRLLRFKLSKSSVHNGFLVLDELSPVWRSPQSVTKGGATLVRIDGRDLGRRVPSVATTKSTSYDVLVNLWERVGGKHSHEFEGDVLARATGRRRHFLPARLVPPREFSVRGCCHIMCRLMITNIDKGGRCSQSNGDI